MSVTSWFLKSSAGTRHRLPREMIFVGRDDCELMLQSRSVDKQHAVINYDSNTDEHMVKDLGSLNGTFVNDLRIPDQTYITLKLSDVIRFGYDAHVYILEKSQHKVPEEALKHEKYTSQLQMSIKALEAKTKEKWLHSQEKSMDFVSKVKHQDRAERKAHSFTAATESPISKPTPLYGQPSWWGEDDDPANKTTTEGKQPGLETQDSAKDVSRNELNGSLSDSQAKSIFSYRREPSYFEIPTKELHQRPAKKPESQVHEIPTKDIPDLSDGVLSTPTPPVVQSHASFTIEFDDCTPGKMKIKDHVTKFSLRQQKKLPNSEIATTPTEIMSAESKVADWLVQSNASMVRRRSQAEDLYSTTSDPSMQKIRNSNWEDGSHSDSGAPGTVGDDLLTSDVKSSSHVSHHHSHSPPERYASPESEEPTSPEPHSFHGSTKAETKQAFVIEFFDDNQRKKRSQSFTNNTMPQQVPGLRPEVEKSKRSPSPTEARTPPTQRYTVPLKGCDSPGPQRAGSLRREKTEERISTTFSSRSTSSVSSRPFSSVGRKSKLARDFTAEFLKQTEQIVLTERKINNPTTAQDALPVQNTHSTSPPNTTNQPQTSSPIHHPVPLNSTVTSVTHDSSEAKNPHCSRHDEDDSLSDAGTYTIEADVQDKELEEARSNIDQVFGVQTNHIEVEASTTDRPVIVSDSEQPRQGSSRQIEPPKWMSRWASLADSYAECEPSSNILNSSTLMEPSDAACGPNRHKATFGQSWESADAGTTNQASIGNNSDIQTPSIHVHYDIQSTFEIEKSSLVPPRSQENPLRLSVQDDVEPDSLSDASNSGDGSIIEQRKKPLQDSEKKREPPTFQPKSTSFYIGSEENVMQLECTVKVDKKNSGKTFSTATLTKQRAGQESWKVRPSISSPALGQNAQAEPTDNVGTSLVRQESFTKDRPSNAWLPNISSPESVQGSGSQDTHSYLKQTEDVLAFLEAKLQATHTAPSPSPVMDSAESDVDTSSTLSQQSNKNKPNQVSKKPSNSFHRERSSASITSQDSNVQSSVSEKQRILKTDTFRKPSGLRHSIGKHGSIDLSDDYQNSSRPYSDQESSHPQVSRKYTVPLQKEESKPTKVSQALSRANSLSAPRPTRASMLRRARLGESDNEGPETEKLSQDSQKQPQEPKKLSRWDMLAMPRKRTGSFNTPSDNEASSGPQWTGRSTGSNRNADTGANSGRRSSIPGNKTVERPQKPPLNKTPITRVRASSAKYTSSTASSRRRQKGSDYTSTSDEEYDSNQSTPKPKRSQPSSASHSPRSQPRPPPVVALRPMSRNKDSEDENPEGEAFHNWSAHSAEIARLSEDLAKDLAILAREIHDVAGDGNASDLSATSSAPVSTHEQLKPNISEPGLNDQRDLAASTVVTELIHKSGLQQSIRQQGQNKEQVQMSSQLDPVSQIIGSIKENTEELSEKIKVLFQDKLEIWEEIEARIHADDNSSVVKTSNKEIASILLELRRVQLQLEVMNTIIKPSDQREVRTNSALSSGVRPSRVMASQEWRTTPPVSRRGGGPRPGDRVRRPAVASDGREGYLV